MVPTCACCNRSSVGGAGLNICSNKQLWRWMDRQVFSQGYGPPISHPPPSLLTLNYAFTHSLATMHHAPCNHASYHHSMPPCHPYLPRLCDCWLHTYFSGGFARWLGMFTVCFWIPGMGVFELHKAKNIVWILGWRPKDQYHYTA